MVGGKGLIGIVLAAGALLTGGCSRQPRIVIERLPVGDASRQARHIGGKSTFFTGLKNYFQFHYSIPPNNNIFCIYHIAVMNDFISSSRYT